MTCEGRNLPPQLIARKLTSSIAPDPVVRTVYGPTGKPRKLTNARVNDHVHVNSLIRNHLKWLRFRADAAALRPASLHIQDVIARWKCGAVFSIFVCR